MTIRSAVAALTDEQRRGLALQADQHAATTTGPLTAVWRELYGLAMADEMTDEAADLALTLAIDPDGNAGYLTTADVQAASAPLTAEDAARIFPPRTNTESRVYGAAGAIRDLADGCMAMEEDDLDRLDVILARAVLALRDAGFETPGDDE